MFFKKKKQTVEEMLQPYENLYFDEEIKYLSKFYQSKRCDFETDYRTYKEQNGFGMFENSDTIYQAFYDILGTSDDVFSDMRIPEKYPSPDAFVSNLKQYYKYLNDKILYFDNEIAKYSSDDAAFFIIDKVRQNFLMVENSIDYILKKIGEKQMNVEKGNEILINIFNKFGDCSRKLQNRYSNRKTIQVNNEYDVQDLLHVLLIPFFDDIRLEEYCSCYAGSSSRADFLLKQEKIMIETKMTRSNLKDKEIGNQLIEDIAKYKHHPDCKSLYCFVFDPAHFIVDEKGLIDDLEKLSTTLPVRVFIGH